MVGASAGGVEALSMLVRGLPEDLPAAVVVVLHLPSAGTSVLPVILNRASAMPAIAATDGQPLAPGQIYVASPDHHLIVARGGLALNHGPRENGHRPSIDALFRTAALSCGPQTIGVILSGTLDDGAAGLGVIKEHGGAVVVQDPADATYDGMPRAAIARVEVDHVVAMREMPALLVALTGAGDPAAVAARDTPDPVVPAPTSENAASGFICPDCGGALWPVDEGGVARYRCRIGHAYSEDSLLTQQGADVEAALWAALRSLEERAELLRRLSSRAAAGGSAKTAASFIDRALDAERQAEIIRAGVLPVPLAVTSDGENAAQ